MNALIKKINQTVESINHTQAHHNQELKPKIKNIILKVDNKGHLAYR